MTVSGSLGMLPQNPQTLFVKKTVRECAPRKKAKPTREDLIAQNIERYNGTAGNQIRLEE